MAPMLAFRRFAAGVCLVTWGCSQPFQAGPPDGGASGQVVLPVTRSLLLWLRADAETRAPGDAVTRWSDQSGNHLDAEQADAPRQPVWKAADLAGHPAVHFEGEAYLS